MEDNIEIINSLSKHLFWDIDKSIIDKQKHSKYIIRKVLQYGLYADWETLLVLYDLDKIISIAKTIKDLDKKTASFLSVISGVPKNKFLCYTTKQSIPKHWNF